MKSFKNLGTANKEFQRYRNLSKVLSDISDQSGNANAKSYVSNFPRLRSLLEAWFYHLGNILRTSQGTVHYHDRSGDLRYTQSYKEPFTWSTEVQEPFLSQLLNSHQLFLVNSDFVVVKFHFQNAGYAVCGLKRKEAAYSTEELGLLGECVHLLKEKFEWYRKLQLEELKTKVIDRNIMLKELRPKNLFYNLIYNAHRIVPYNHSATIITPEYKSNSLSITAEVFRFSSDHSWRIGDSFSFGSDDWNRLLALNSFQIVNSDTPEEATHIGPILFNSLYNDSQIPSPKSLIAIPFRYADANNSLIIALLLLADQRTGFFNDLDGYDISVLVNTASPIIYNSLNFGQKLELFMKELESQLISNTQWDDDLCKITQLLEKRFEASLCRIFLLENQQINLTSSIKVETCLSDEGSKIEKSQIYPSDSLLKPLLSERRIIAIRDLSLLKNFELSHITEKYALKSVIASPITFDNQVLGFITCFYENARAFSQFEHYQLESVAQRIGSVIAHRRSTTQQLNDLTDVLHIMERISSTDEDQSVRNQLVIETKNILKADYCFISVPDDTGKNLITNAKTWRNQFDVPTIKITGKPKDGITSYVAKKRQLYATNDVAKDPYFTNIVPRSSKTAHIKSEMAAPLLSNNKLIGVIDVMSSREGAFGIREKTLLKMLLNQSSLAIENARVAREKRDQITIINAIQSRLVHLTIPDEIYKMALETALTYVSQFHPDIEIYGNLYVRRPGTQILEVKAFIGERGNEFSPSQYLGEGVVGYVAKTGKALIIHDTSRPPARIVYRPFIKGIVSGSEISVPIMVGKEVNSVLNLESPIKRLFRHKDLEVLTALANEISVAVKFAQLHDELNKEQETKFYRQELKFLKVLSHEVMRSTKNTKNEIPKLRRHLQSDPAALEILERIEGEVKTTIEAQDRLIPFAITKEFSPVDVIATLNIVLQRSDRRFDGVSIQKRIETPEFYMDGSEEFIAYIFENLVRNSKDATPNGGAISVEEQKTIQTSRLILLFSDNGHGIPPHIANKIWEPYFSDNGQGKMKGLGLGLWLVKDLMQRMNGEIKLLESIPFKKTTFMLVFNQNL